MKTCLYLRTQLFIGLNLTGKLGQLAGASKLDISCLVFLKIRKKVSLANCLEFDSDNGSSDIFDEVANLFLLVFMLPYLFYIILSE